MRLCILICAPCCWRTHSPVLSGQASQIPEWSCKMQTCRNDVCSFQRIQKHYTIPRHTSVCIKLAYCQQNHRTSTKEVEKSCSREFVSLTSSNTDKVWVKVGERNASGQGLGEWHAQCSACCTCLRHEFDSTGIAACVCNANTGKAKTGGSLRFAYQSNWISKLQVDRETLSQKNQAWAMRGRSQCWPLDFAGTHCILTLSCACMHMNMYIHRRNTLSVMKTSGKEDLWRNLPEQIPHLWKALKAFWRGAKITRQKLWGRSHGTQLSIGENQYCMSAQQKGPEDELKGCWEVSSRSHQY